MEFVATPIAGAVLVRQQRQLDERGYFARTFCAREFSKQVLVDRFVQSSVSYNEQRGTLRGMHWSVSPHEETKLVSCLSGTIHDVIADLRPDSSTRGRWTAFELSAASGDALYIPAGVAHGFLTLTPHAVVSYEISAYFEPTASRGFRFDDPTLAIEWPFSPSVVSQRDQSYAPFTW